MFPDLKLLMDVSVQFLRRMEEILIKAPPAAATNLTKPEVRHVSAESSNMSHLVLLHMIRPLVVGIIFLMHMRACRKKGLRFKRLRWTLQQCTRA